MSSTSQRPSTGAAGSAGTPPAPPGMVRSRSANKSRTGISGTGTSGQASNVGGSSAKEKDKDKDKDKKKDFKVLRPDSFSQGVSLYLREPPPEIKPKEIVRTTTSSAASRDKPKARTPQPSHSASSSKVPAKSPTPRATPSVTSSASSSSSASSAAMAAAAAARAARSRTTTASTANGRATPGTAHSTSALSPPRTRIARPPGSTTTASKRPLLRSANLLAPITLQKEIVIVTSRGTFIVKAGPESTIDWALEVASDLMMAANPLGAVDDGTRVVLVAARTGSGAIASEEDLVFDVCKEDKILFAITADETTNIPPSFAHAFAAAPINDEEHQRALRLQRSDSSAGALNLVSGSSSTSTSTNPLESKGLQSGSGIPILSTHIKRKPALEKFRSNIRMSVAMTNYVDDLDAMVHQLEKTEAEAAKKAEENKRLRDEEPLRPLGFENADDEDDENQHHEVAAVTILNPFGAETESDVVVVVDGDEVSDNHNEPMPDDSSGGRRSEEDYLAPPKQAPPATKAEKLSRRLTRASALSILMDI
ncbi:hypothetical protein HK100_002498, partial [Physocladia obscura]